MKELKGEAEGPRKWQTDLEAHVQKRIKKYARKGKIK